MEKLIETLKIQVGIGGELAELLLNILSLVCILIGLVASLRKSFRYRKGDPGDHPLHSFFRKEFGGWLVVALEFQLAADIVGTIIYPTTEHLIQLGAIAVIRTFLNYFLSKELKEEKLPLKTGKKETNIKILTTS